MAVAVEHRLGLSGVMIGRRGSSTPVVIACKTLEVCSRASEIHRDNIARELLEE